MSVEITLLHPDAAPAASLMAPSNARSLGVCLHTISVHGGTRSDNSQDPDFAAAMSELQDMDDHKKSHDLNGPFLYLSNNTKLSALFTHHKTRVYADVNRGLLLHGQDESVPHNLFMAVARSMVRLVHINDLGHARIVRMRPEGPFAAEADLTGLSRDGFADEFALVQRKGTADDGIALTAAGLLLCAEENGELRLSRHDVGSWETFRVFPGKLNEPVLPALLSDLDADMAYLVNAISGARIEDELRPLVEKIRSRVIILGDILRHG